MKNGRLLRIVIADDHRVFAQGLASLLADESMQVVAVAADRDELLAIILKHDPDVAIVDFSMPGMGLLDLQATIFDRRIATRLLVLTANDDPRVARDLLLAGVSGYLLKDHAFDEVALGIRAVAANKSYVSPQLAGAMLSHSSHGQSPDALTDRQLEVLRLVAAGDTSKRIAGKLGIQATTVDKHRDRIRVKLGVQSAAEMIRVASERGLI